MLLLYDCIIFTNCLFVFNLLDNLNILQVKFKVNLSQGLKTFIVTEPAIHEKRLGLLCWSVPAHTQGVPEKD